MAYGHGTSLGVFRVALGVGVDEAGSISGARARSVAHLQCGSVYSSVAWRAVSLPAQWQRSRMWIYGAAPHRTARYERGRVKLSICGSIWLLK